MEKTRQAFLEAVKNDPSVKRMRRLLGEDDEGRTNVTICEWYNDALICKGECMHPKVGSGKQGYASIRYCKDLRTKNNPIKCPIGQVFP
jgi:hypothetical protein